MSKVRSALNLRFQGGTAPDVLFTDRGQGFYTIKQGKITPEYKAALQEHGLRAYYGDDASIQPGSLQEVLLHETAVAWIRRRESQTQPRQAWTETVAEFSSRLRAIAQHINNNYDVDGLCRGLPKRLQLLIDAEGDRIPK